MDQALDDPDKTLELPLDAPDHPANWHAPTPTLAVPRQYAKTASPLTRPSLDGGERAFAVGMVCFALAGLVLMVLRSDWWGA